MDVSYRRFLLGLAFLPICLPRVAAAGPPVVNHLPLPTRDFPSEQELNLFLEPKPPFAIPDDPPPREGALIDAPYVIEPPDLLRVEVLEALPGRPIAGERLVRPDGTISLGFYGDVHVKGLTIEQAKTKVLLHLRNFINDDYLGLYRVANAEADSASASADAESAEDLEGADERRLESETQEPTPAVEPIPDEAPPVKRRLERPRKRGRKRAESRNSTGRRGRPTPPSGESDQKPASPKAVRTEDEAASPARMKPLEPPPVDLASVRSVHPADSDRLFVDVTAYNSKVYYVLGDVASPGRLPFTGSTTVLDALSFANGFLSTANRKDVQLVRPSPGGGPARIYQVDYDAITLKGDVKTNYQLFPGDRLVVGRNPVVQQTIEIDRIAAPLQTIFNSILQYSFMARSVQNLGTATTNTNPGATSLTEDQRAAMLKVWAEFWSKALTEGGDGVLDEPKLREALLRALESTKEGEKSKPK